MLQMIVTHPVPFPKGHKETLPEMGEIFMQVSMLEKKTMEFLCLYNSLLEFCVHSP